MYTFGVGAFVDLPNFSVVIGGLDGWEEMYQTEILEKRLLAVVRSDESLELGSVTALRSPPWMEETSSVFDKWASVGVPAYPMPRWMRCTACNTLTTIDGGLLELKTEYRPDRTRWVHRDCTRGGRRAPMAMPARFVVACPRGHVDEFPWMEFVHSATGGRCPAGGALLRTMDTGSGSRSTDVVVECLSCQAKRMMTNAFNQNAAEVLPRCRGRHAHLQRFEAGCEHQVRPLLLGASNIWFPVTRSVLSIPAREDACGQAVSACWPAIIDPNGPIDSPEMLDFAIKRDPRLRPLQGPPLETVWARILTRKEGGPDPEETEILGPEWAVFTDPGRPPSSEDFRLGVPVKLPGFPGVEAVVPVERLREVVALCGFTRVDAPEALGDEDARVECAPLAKGSPNWLPAAEVRGEGIFVRLREETVATWVERARSDGGMKALYAAHRRGRQQRGLPDPGRGWPGARYVLLHSLAHALIREISRECGYSTASVRERIYSREPGTDGSGAMAGILLYTAAPDSEGTLGGLVALANPDHFRRLLDATLRRLELCSADPMCAGHAPSETEITLHNAACHACLFLPETSCEKSNRYLDRGLLVETVAGRGAQIELRR